MNPVLARAAAEFAHKHRRGLAVVVFLAPVAAAFMVVVLAMVLIIGPLDGSTTAASTTGCVVDLPDDMPSVDDLSDVQVAHAAEIVAEGKARHVPPFGWAVGIAVAIQESNLSNLASEAVPESLRYDHDGVAAGDHDSVGIMQQRTGWGTVKQRMTPTVSIGFFYDGGTAGEPGLLDIHGWQQMDLTVAAQAVQVSAYPTAYAAHEQIAYALVEALSDVDLGTCGVPAGNGEWVNPLDPDGDGNPAYVNLHNFGACQSSLWADCHTGDDLSGVDRVPVYAPTAGRVVFAGDGGAYGNLVEIEDSEGVVVYLAHNTSLLVSVGDVVKAGHQVSVSGDTGNTTGPHLHVEIRVKGLPVDPDVWFEDHKVRL